MYYVNYLSCPVCGYEPDEELDYILIDWDICPSCGTQFSYTDANTTHHELRCQWLESGAQWYSAVKPVPPAFNAIDQLSKAGLDHE